MKKICLVLGAGVAMAMAMASTALGSERTQNQVTVVTGFAKVLPADKQAVIIEISPDTGTGANLIMPGDQVDVVLAGKQSGQTGTNIVLSDVRVLAIDQKVEERNGQKIVVGKTATLQVLPSQTKTLAETSGVLALALRPIGGSAQAVSVPQLTEERISNQSARAFNRAEAYHKQGQFDLAIAEYDEIIRMHPTYYKSYSRRGIVYERKGDYDRAIADYTIAIQYHAEKRSSEYLYIGGAASDFAERGIAYYKKKDYDRAIADFNQAIEFKTHDSYIGLKGRGLARLAKGDKAGGNADLAEYERQRMGRPGTTWHRTGVAPSPW